MKNKRIKFIRWLRSIFKVPEGQILPLPLKIINICLFPSLVLYKNKDWYYDWESECFYILGGRYSRAYFEMFSTADIGLQFEIINRETTYDGFNEVTVKNLPPVKLFKLKEWIDWHDKLNKAGKLDDDDQVFLMGMKKAWELLTGEKKEY